MLIILIALSITDKDKDKDKDTPYEYVPNVPCIEGKLLHDIVQGCE